MQFLTNIDLAKNELQNARIQNLAAAPVGPLSGQIYFNSVDKVLYSWDGLAWKNMFSMTIEEIVILLNASSLKIDDDNLSVNVNDALSKRHAHTNTAILDAITAAYTTAEKTKLTGIATGASKTENSATNGNIKINGAETNVYTHPAGTNPHGTTKTDVGLGSVENKSSATIRGELTSANVTTALGYSPIKGVGVPEVRSGLESARPAASNSSLVYLAIDTKKIYQDTGSWVQLGGQDTIAWADVTGRPSTFAPSAHTHSWFELTGKPTTFTPPVASPTVLGGIKVGANLSVLPDGTLNANDNPASFIRKQERFTVGAGQTIFNLTKGTYKPNTSAITWFLNGDKQDDSALTETSSTRVTLPSGLPEGNEILFEYFEVINMHPFPMHASEHLTGGADPIPVVTQLADGLMAKEDKSKLNGIATGANNYVHPTNHPPSVITQDASNRFVTDAEKTTWNGKASTAIATTGANGLMSAGDKTKLDGVAAGANNYVHPANHPPSIITQDVNNRFVTDTEKTSWSNKAEKIIATAIADGLMSKADKSKLDGVAAGANNYVHPASHPASMITGLTPVATTGSYNDLSNKPTLGTVSDKNTGTTNGTVPIIGSDGKLDASIMPALAITDTFVVSTQAAMLALSVQVGDVCVRTDQSKSYILRVEPATVLANWQELLTPSDVVQSVNGKTGAVTLSKGDVGLSLVDNIQQATKAEFNTHNTDNTRHITAPERTDWNAKTAKFAANIGNGSATTFVVNHKLNTQDVTVTLRQATAPFSVVFADIEITDVNNIKLLLGSAPTTNQYRVTVTG